MASINQALASRGIDVQRAIRNLKQRARYHQHLDREAQEVAARLIRKIKKMSSKGVTA